jgi:hypothetical protein
MEIKEDHKKLLKAMGLTEEDFKRFDGKEVTYEFDQEKGARLYDPYYATSYSEYIDVDGWSSWSSEQDTFMSNILEKAQAEASRKEAISPKATQEEITKAMQKKFGKKDEQIP